MRLTHRLPSINGPNEHPIEPTMRLIFKTIPAVAVLASFIGLTAHADVLTASTYVNGITLNGGATDLSQGTSAERRLGYFSDLYYDANRNEWWGLSDRGPGGGLLNYETRVQRFTLDIASNGAISNFQVAQTIKFRDPGTTSVPGGSFNGLAPNPTSNLGRALDPEGVVIHPKTGNLLVSDEYGPSLLEFDRNGNLLRRFTTPANLVPRNATSGTANYASDAGNTAGKRTNRGFEGLAISPDGKFTYAMLQSAMLDEGGGNGVYSRIVKFDNANGMALAQYAYRMDTAGQGRGISSLVALGNDKFLVLERNNRGLGIGATVSPADKVVYEISLTGAVDVSNTVLPATGAFAGAVIKTPKKMDLDANTQAALGNKSPEKWEGLSVGPLLGNGQYLMLAGTDNDYSVTQSGTGEQYDVWFDFSLADPYANSLQCPIGSTANCFLTNGGAASPWNDQLALLPGVLHAYAVNLEGYVTPVSEPGSALLALTGLVALAGFRRRGANQGKVMQPEANITFSRIALK